MLTLDQVKEVLNVNTPLVYALVRSGELRAASSSPGTSGACAKLTCWPTLRPPATGRRSG